MLGRLNFLKATPYTRISTSEDTVKGMEQTTSGLSDSLPEDAYYACQNKDFERLKELLTCDRAIAIHKHPLINHERMPLICVAAQNGNEPMVRLLLKYDADINATFENDATSLMLAAQKGYLEIVRLLIASGANANEMSSNGITPLILATQNKHWSTFDLLVEKGANVNPQGVMTALHRASYKGCTQSVQKLLAAGADMKLTDKDGHTALEVAEQQGNRQVVKLLLSMGAGPKGAAKLQKHPSSNT